MIDILWLATTVVGKFLLPLLTKGKDELTDDLAKTGGEAAANGLVKTAESIWSSIKRRFTRDDEKKTVELFEQDPEDMDKMLVKLLRQRLEEDAAFCGEIQQLVEAPVAGSGQTSWQVMDHSGVVDARYSTISGGTVAGLIINTGPTQPPPGNRNAASGDVDQP
jgi:hypothetical protein